VSSEGDQFATIIEEVRKRSRIVNEAIEKYLPLKEPEGLYKAARHLIDAGGKRLRPVMCLLASEAIGAEIAAIKAAVAVETVHNFTLIHDDIMDRDEMRRGVKTVHTLYGEETAILAGDTLFAKAFSILASDEAHRPENVVKACKMLADVCVEICEGQYIDMSFEDRDIREVSEEEYLEMVRKKTAVLIACSCSIPAVLSGEENYARALWKFGELCGIGFQIHDDVLDLIGGEKIGKDWGSDLVEGKKTLIMIEASRLGVEIPVFGKGKASKKEIEEAVRILEDCGAIAYARKKAKEFVEKGKRELEKLPDSEAKKLLEGIADYLISREY